MKHPLLWFALLCSTGATLPAQAGLVKCTQPDGVPLFTDHASATRHACTAFDPGPFGLSVNKSLPLGPPTSGISPRTQREIKRARASRQAIQAEAREKRRYCQRARTRAAAAWTLPLGRRAALNRAAYYACQ